MIAFVTGGSGFVGRELIRALRARGDEVVALARSDAAASSVEKVGAKAARGDLDDDAALRAAVSGVDVVFHVAAKVETWGKYEDFVRVNVEGTRRVAEAAAGKKIVHVSTEAVLCGRPIVNADETVPYPDKPIGFYGSTKAEAEKIMRAAGGVIVRPRAIWGKGDTSLLPQLVASAKAGKFAWIGGGRHLTSTCHVRNCVEGMLLAASKGKAGEAYFLTDGAPIEMRAWLTRMLATQCVDLSTARSVPRWVARMASAAAEATAGKKRPPLDRTIVRLLGEEVTVSDAKARRELGYVGRVSIDDGMNELRPS
jgi:nucleoside-diphosphate-sugar epimerase